MRKRIRPLSYTTVLVMLIVAIFLVGMASPAYAQKEGFRTYKLVVYCGNSGVASVIFSHEVTEGGTAGRPLMGTHVENVGNCPSCKGVPVPLVDALAKLPVEVSAALKAMVDKHQADAAAGKNRPLTCLGACGSQAWEDYKRNLKIVLGIWDDADKEFDRGLEEFKVAKEEIRRDMVGEIAEEFAEESLPTIIEYIVKKTGKAKVLIKPIGGEAANVAGAGGSVILFVTEAGMIFKNVQVSVDNLEYSAQSHNKMRLRADEKWKQALDDLERALAKDKACEEANAETAAKAKAERKLEQQARKYLDENFDNFHKTYRIGSTEYKDANAALEAAKKIIEAHHKGRSGYVKQESMIRAAAYAPGGPLIGLDRSITSQQLQEAIRQLNLTESHLRRGTTLILKALKVYRNMRQNLDSSRSRMSTGAGPEPQEQLLPSPKQTPKTPRSRP